MEFLVNLKEVEDVKTFANYANNYSCDILVRSQDKNFVVDGSSILGILSLDLSRPVKVEVKNIEAGESFKNDIYKMIVE